jgi:hypothetical protein
MKLILAQAGRKRSNQSFDRKQTMPTEMRGMPLDQP